MDKWLLSKLNTVIKAVDDDLEHYRIPEARLERIYRIALTLAHLLAVLVLHVPQHDNILKRRAVKQ